MASAIVRTRERPPRMPARRYLLGASDRVCVPLHQLLEGDGLRVCSTGDLEMWENQSQAGCRIPPPPSLPPSLRAKQGLGPGGGLPLLPGGPPTTSLRRCPAIHNQRRGRGQPSGRVALALMCVPGAVTNSRRKGHTVEGTQDTHLDGIGGPGALSPLKLRGLPRPLQGLH